MRILVVGSGGREHAICRALVDAGPDAPEILALPGNPGTDSIATNLAGSVSDIEGIVAAAREHRVDLVIPGPEAPLVAGLADALARADIPCCGPSAAAARLEGSKLFTRELAERSKVPSPRFTVARSVAELDRALAEWSEPPVVKADGLAAGKGVSLPDDLAGCREDAEALLGGSLGEAGRTVVFEERLHGIEASLFYACHGTDAVSLPHARDHKRLGDGDQGPNTGGMGAISPNPVLTDSLEAEVHDRVVQPVLAALADDGTPFVGFLFVGVMITDAGPKLLEFNVRLGDPEAQAILPRLAAGEMTRLAHATARGDLTSFSLRTRAEATCAIVVAAPGYPAAPRTGAPITVADGLETEQRWLVHAGTKRQQNQLRTAGGRVAAIVARAATADEARRLAYAGVELVRFEEMRFRHDIGTSS